MISTYQIPFSCLLVIQIFFAVSRCDAQSITEGMQKQIPSIIEQLNNRKLRNVGVLKFRVRKPGMQEPAHNVGPINSLLADRLELGLILANPFEKSKQLKIIESASDEVAKIKGANHRTVEGREKLFGHSFPVAWGSEEVEPDAFITGGVNIKNDNVTAQVILLLVTKNGAEAEKIGEQFEAKLDAQSLAEAGESFMFRGIFDEGKAVQTANQTVLDRLKVTREKQNARVRQNVQQVLAGTVKNPLESRFAPVTLRVTYDGMEIPIQKQGNQLVIAEPKQGQKVEFHIAPKSANRKQRLGIVLKINGENTLFREKRRNIDCSKWILEPSNTNPLPITGFQFDLGEQKPIVVLTDQESKQVEMNYGREVGQIQMTVYREHHGQKLEDLVIEESEEDLLAIFRGIHPHKQPQTLADLKHQIRLASRQKMQTRGLMVAGEGKVANKVKSVEFVPASTPVMSVTINYYNPNTTNVMPTNISN